jgi:hypothetical protein
MSENGTLSPKQHAAIAALMSAKDQRAAARASGTSERQLYRWLAQPEFVAALQAAEAQAIATAIRRLADLSGTAIDVLRAAMTDPEAAHVVKIRAADIAIGRLMPLKELADLEARLAALERAVKA